MTTQPLEIQYTQIVDSQQDFKKILNISATLPVMEKIKLGKLGESCAENFLLSQNYTIIQKNFHSRFGEIDIIALYENELIFVEVKTRTSLRFGTPQEAVNYQKCRKILKTGLCFLNSSTKKYRSNLRIDVIAVELDQNCKLKNISHFKNILDG